MTRAAQNPTADAGWAAHRAAIAHLEACGDAMFDAEQSDDPDGVESPAIAPYCGCTDCDVRETLAVAWPILLEDAATIVGGAGHAEAAALLRAETARLSRIVSVTPRNTADG